MDTGALVTWLLTEGRRSADGPTAFAGLCDRLVGLGVPLFRCWYGGLLLHPLVYAAGCTWRRGGEVVVNRRPHGFERSPMWAKSPAIRVLQGDASVRCRIGVDPVDYPVVADLAALGATDYFMHATDLDGRPTFAISWTTDRSGGFTDADLTVLGAIQPALGALLEIHARREIASTVVRTYLGRDAGDRVLSGNIRRGDGETVRAALWFSDLRDFTGLSDRLPRDALLSLLDDAFGAQVTAVEDAGGTVLKFMGDGLLAIFGAGDDDGGSACRAALAAARQARRSTEEVNQRRAQGGQVEIRYGLGLHYGDVQYGNIGGPQRLDFTVIGPAVNRAARLEALCARLGQPLVASRDFATRCGEALPSAGHHTLKGVADPVEVFAPPREGGD